MLKSFIGIGKKYMYKLYDIGKKMIHKSMLNSLPSFLSLLLSKKLGAFQRPGTKNSIDKWFAYFFFHSKWKKTANKRFTLYKKFKTYYYLVVFHRIVKKIGSYFFHQFNVTKERAIKY